MKHVVVPERVESALSSLWITRRFAKIQSSRETIYGNGSDVNSHWQIEGLVKVKTLRERQFKLSFESARLYPHGIPCVENFSSQIPTLSLYLTNKKAKNRMVDIEENGILLESLFSSYLQDVNRSNPFNFEIPLDQITRLNEVFDFKGIVIVKRKGHKPLSEYPIIVGHATFLENKRLSELPTQLTLSNSLDQE